jgi:hypothetical protein
MSLPEDGPLPSIEEFFANLGFRIVVHQQPPPDPSAEEWRRMSSVERRARRAFHPAYWADLENLVTSSRVRWYGGGDTEEAALRSARARWRVEQDGASTS